MRIRVSWALGVIVGLAGCRPAAAPGGASEADVEMPATMEACAREAAAKRADDGAPAAYRLTVHVRVEVAAYRASALCVVTDRGHVIYLDEESLARAAVNTGDARIEIRTSEPLRVVASRFALIDPLRPSYHWYGLTRHELMGVIAAREITVGVYEKTDRPRSEWPQLSSGDGSAEPRTGRDGGIE